jgi:hypothetical protein
MPQTEYEAAIAEFLRKNSVTRCPTACVAPTRTAVADADRAALCNYSAARKPRVLKSCATTSSG